MYHKEGSPRKTPLAQTPEDQAQMKEFLTLLGDPKQVAQELREFSEQAKDYDPMPHTTLILDVETVLPVSS